MTLPGRDVIHSDMLRKRSASSLVESWVPPSVVASAVLLRAQTQGRAAQVDPPHRNFLGPTLPSVSKAVPKPSYNTARTPLVPLDSSVLPKDPSLSELLEKVASLKQRLSARRSLGGLWLTKLQNVLEISIGNVKNCPVSASDVSSDTLSETDKGDAGLVPSRGGNRIQITGEREPGKFLASGLQQIKLFVVSTWRGEQ